MPRLSGVRQRRQQPFWDSIIRTTGVPVTPVPPNVRLFGNANVGQLGLTNLEVPGQLASDQTFVILAMRVYLFFDGTNRRENYLNVANQLIFTLTLGDRPQFVAPAWYHPAGGGIWGFDSATSIFNNGDPGQDEIAKLARPIILPVRQNFSVSGEFVAIGGTNALTLLNAGADDDQKVIQYYIDGLQTRDVE